MKKGDLLIILTRVSAPEGRTAVGSNTDEFVEYFMPRETRRPDPHRVWKGHTQIGEETHQYCLLVLHGYLELFLEGDKDLLQEAINEAINDNRASHRIVEIISERFNRAIKDCGIEVKEYGRTIFVMHAHREMPVDKLYSGLMQTLGMQWVNFYGTGRGAVGVVRGLAERVRQYDSLDDPKIELLHSACDYLCEFIPYALPSEFSEYAHGMIGTFAALANDMQYLLEQKDMNRKKALIDILSDHRQVPNYYQSRLDIAVKITDDFKNYLQSANKIDDERMELVAHKLGALNPDKLKTRKKQAIIAIDRDIKRRMKDPAVKNILRKLDELSAESDTSPKLEISDKEIETFNNWFQALHADLEKLGRILSSLPKEKDTLLA
jgi:hypothetical protein